MPKKAEPVREENLESKKMTIQVPLNLNKLKKISSTQLLVTLLVVAAFLIGVLFTKVQYLEKNPGIGGQAGQPAGQAGAVVTPAPGAKVDVGTGHFPIKGDPKAKVTIVEFADFRCPFCEQFFTQTEPQIIKNYVDTGKVKYAFRQYPFLGPASVVAANAAECANDQDKFWEFHEYLFKNQPDESDTSMYNTDTLTQAAVSLGLDGNSFRSCLDNKTDDSKQAKDLSEGQAAGVSGTPTFFVNGISLVGAQPYSAFQTLIDQELAKAK